jgi:hypothetical protein
MNSQILKLARKSGATVNQGFDGTKNFVYGITMSPEELEKFAELIVRECMDIADEQKKWVEDMEVFNEQDAVWNRARIQQSQQIVDKIKQHFGVEE